MSPHSRVPTVWAGTWNKASQTHKHKHRTVDHPKTVSGIHLFTLLQISRANWSPAWLLKMLYCKSSWEWWLSPWVHRCLGPKPVRKVKCVTSAASWRRKTLQKWLIHEHVFMLLTPPLIHERNRRISNIMLLNESHPKHTQQLQSAGGMKICWSPKVRHEMFRLGMRYPWMLGRLSPLSKHRAFSV